MVICVIYRDPGHSVWFARYHLVSEHSLWVNSHRYAIRASLSVHLCLLSIYTYMDMRHGSSCSLVDYKNKSRMVICDQILSECLFSLKVQRKRNIRIFWRLNSSSIMTFPDVWISFACNQTNHDSVSDSGVCKKKKEKKDQTSMIDEHFLITSSAHCGSAWRETSRTKAL